MYELPRPSQASGFGEDNGVRRNVIDVNDNVDGKMAINASCIFRVIDNTYFVHRIS